MWGHFALFGAPPACAASMVRSAINHRDADTLNAEIDRGSEGFPQVCEQNRSPNAQEDSAADNPWQPSGRFGLSALSQEPSHQAVAGNQFGRGCTLFGVHAAGAVDL